MSDFPVLMVGTDCEASRILARSVEAEFTALPACDSPELFEAWRQDVIDGPAHAAFVIAQFTDRRNPGAFREMDPEQWRARFERPFLLWNLALGAAARRCLDGGTIVAVVQAPAALDSPGWTPEFAIADGVLGLVRSVASAEGSRGVRANLVSTPIGLVGADVIAPAPPLPSFPGQLDAEVSGAVRTFLSPDSVGLTGRVLSADGGRAL